MSDDVTKCAKKIVTEAQQMLKEWEAFLKDCEAKKAKYIKTPSKHPKDIKKLNDAVKLKLKKLRSQAIEMALFQNHVAEAGERLGKINEVCCGMLSEVLPSFKKIATTTGVDQGVEIFRMYCEDTPVIKKYKRGGSAWKF